MRTDLVEQLSAWLAETDIALLELRGPNMLLRLGHDAAGAAIPARSTPVAPAAHAPTRRLTVNAPSVGVFLHAHPLHPAALAPVGTRVRAGEAVGLLQIGALLLPVPAPQAAMVIGVHVAHGATVGYGTPLVDLDPL